MEHKWSDILSKGIEFLSISIAVASISLLLSVRGRTAWKYAAASVIAGTIVGLVIWSTPAVTEWAYLASILGAITGPTTLIAWQKKTVVEVLDELKEVAKKDGIDG